MSVDAIRDVVAIAGTWRTEAAERRRISALDPVADTLEYCAAELQLRAREIEHAREEVTPEQYARAEGVTVQTVRTWIRQGRLPARETPKGYRIQKDAKRLMPPLEQLRAS
jgi:DNA-binding transcriptional regulator YiaG